MRKRYIFFIIPLLLISYGFIYADEEASQGESQNSVQPVSQQSFKKWLMNNPRGKRYAGYTEYFNSLFESASEDDIPAELIITKIREGAVKNIPPRRLITAVSNELYRLKTAKNILDTEKIVIRDYSSYKDTLKHISILLLGGVEAKTIKELFKQNDKYSRTENDVLAACDVLVQFNSIAQLSQSDLLKTGRALLMSRLKSASFSSLASIYLNARAKRIKTDDILRIIQRTLSRGGGLIQIDQEISDRGSYR
ncbi:MAG: hypothetical protein DRP57_08325 [Spirochaetes bacterium]|nr:MAG: hypothetical protein DRP57_08325 [Spirochaetota bacterium]